jgi:hypothetical protein
MPRLAVIALLLSTPMLARAADQTILGNNLTVKSTGEVLKRKIIVKAKETASPNTIVGDPIANGATLEVSIDGIDYGGNDYDGVPQSQLFDLPTGLNAKGKPFWSGDATKGYKYKDSKFENGPVKTAQIKKADNGVFQIKATIDSKLGGVNLNGTASRFGCAQLSIGSGDTYHMRFATGEITRSNSGTFKAKKPTTEGLCTPCDWLDTSDCLYPFPSNYFTFDSAPTQTGRQVHFSKASMPKNVGGTPVEPSDYNWNDGFSPGVTILTRVPNVDLGVTGAPPITDIEQSLDPGSPVVVLNAQTHARHLIWAEVDSNATIPTSQAIIIHPAVNFDEGTRYIVALRNMKDSGGALLTPNADFVAYRDGTPLADAEKEGRRPLMEDIFDELEANGIDRSELYLAWDFTVSSSSSMTKRLLKMRDDSFATLGSAAGAFAVTKILEHPCTTSDPGFPQFGACATNADCGPTTGVCNTASDGINGNIFRRVVGTFDVPRYVNSTTPPARFVLDAQGLPILQGTPQVPDFVCNIPRAALANTGATAVPARASIYGHGLLGSNTEVSSGNVQAMANEHNFVFCAAKWIGMANEDIPTAIAILQNFSLFPNLTDRLQQSMLNQLYLARLMKASNGFTTDPAFQDDSGDPVIDRSDVFYDGNSQGGIFGGTVMAVAQDITRGVLGVPGMNYSLLLTRSIDFTAYAAIMNPSYPNQLQRPLLLALAQMLWDRSDPNGYAFHMTSDPLPNTPPHEVLLHVAFGDHQVAPVATEIQARTIGASIHQPAIAPGRHSDVNPYYGIPAIPSYPFNGSALIIWDSGAATPPITNTAPMVGDDPHSDPRNSPVGRQQKSDFLQTGGSVTDVCLGLPCVAP